MKFVDKKVNFIQDYPDACRICKRSTLMDDSATPQDDVLVCDGCEGDVHLACSGHVSVPDGDYRCPSCSLRRRQCFLDSEECVIVSIR